MDAADAHPYAQNELDQCYGCHSATGREHCPTHDDHIDTEAPSKRKIIAALDDIVKALWVLREQILYEPPCRECASLSEIENKWASTNDRSNDDECPPASEMPKSFDSLRVTQIYGIDTWLCLRHGREHLKNAPAARITDRIVAKREKVATS